MHTDKEQLNCSISNSCLILCVCVSVDITEHCHIKLHLGNQCVIENITLNQKESQFDSTSSFLIATQLQFQ